MQSPQSIIIGVGDKENKKRFFEQMNKNIQFTKQKIGDIELYVGNTHRIILTNYFNNRNGIKISGLHDLYRYITTSWKIEI